MNHFINPARHYIKTYTYMKINLLKKVISLTILVFLGISSRMADAQDLTPWQNNPYGNEWIDYSKKYVRVGVPANGVYKVPYGDLALKLKKDGDLAPTPAQIQLFHRGREVTILGADQNFITFYGEKNDGSSDGLMFRPGPEARLNPHISMYSDLSAYFFTSSETPANLISIDAQPSGVKTPEIHFAHDVFTFNTQFAFVSKGVGTQLNPSYFETSNSWTGPYIYGPNGKDFNTGSLEPKYSEKDIVLKNWSSSTPVNPVLKVLVHGLNVGSHNVQILAGKTSADLDLKTLASLPFNGFGGQSATAELTVTEHLNAGGTGKLRVKSTSTHESDWFGLSFYSLTYPQVTDMTGVDAMVFNFRQSNETPGIRRVLISNAPASPLIYDITDPYSPKVVSNWVISGSSIEMDVPNPTSNELKLYAVKPSAITSISSSALIDVDFEPLLKMTNHASPLLGNGAVNPLAFDYIVITHNKLKDVSKAYVSNYRGIAKGGEYRSLVVDIRKIYDEFNYGEPSPIAIRRFMTYMLKDGIRPAKHNLLLIGHTVAWPFPGRLVKEMPGEVPTYGDPGSDVLLVAGLAGANVNVPAIPIGRINAFEPVDVTNYLAKVDHYEHETNLAWRKNVLHLIGGDSPAQVTEFEGIFDVVSPRVKSLDPTRSIKTMANAGSTTNETALITDDVNSGVGMIAYYGHGKETSTLYNMRYVSTTSAPLFTASKRYPFVYFNGCGVGNVFISRVTQTLATDWLLTPDKGAIVVIGNSYKSYIEPTKAYLDILYDQIFGKTDNARRTIGRILVDVASITVTGNPAGRILINDFDITNIHQTTLFGDPAVRVLNTIDPSSLPVDFVNVRASHLDDNTVKVSWETAWEKNNSHFEILRSYNAKNFEVIGTVDAKGEASETSTYSFYDKNPLPGVSYYRIRQVDFQGNDQIQKDMLSKIVSATSRDSDEVIVFPNPTSGVLSIQINDPVGLKDWKLTDSSGKVLNAGTSHAVKTDDISSGIYVLEIRTLNGDIYRKKVVKN